ncbi:MAG: hypothetical protein ACR2PL_06880 [Dehalococcoidia bacterium]
MCCERLVRLFLFAIAGRRATLKRERRLNQGELLIEIHIGERQESRCDTLTARPTKAVFDHAMRGQAQGIAVGSDREAGYIEPFERLLFGKQQWSKAIQVLIP